MSSISEATIPVIDFSKQDLKPGSPEWDSVKIQVRKAVEDYGCFEALSDQILEHRKPVFEAMEELFDLPLQTKKFCVLDEDFTGFASYKPALLECVSINDADVARNIAQRLPSTLWPQGSKNFSETMASFTNLLSRLEKIITMMILESFNIEKHIDDQLFSSTNHHLRIMKYQNPEAIEPPPGLYPHSDLGNMTLLCQNDVNGLEVQNKDGEWREIKQSPNSIIVMMGESFSGWLNGRLPAAYHRVILKESKVRYSLGLFSSPKGGYLIRVPKELEDEKNPLLFKPYDYGEFIKYVTAQRKQGNVNYNLKAYCGV